MAQARSTWLVRPSLFAAVGATNTAIDYAVFWALISFTPLSPVIANIVSFSLGAANSFVMNSLITFGDRKMISRRRSVQRFISVTLLGLALSTSIVGVAVQFVHPLIAKLMSIVLSFALGYLVCSRLVFPAQPHKTLPIA